MIISNKTLCSVDRLHCHRYGKSWHRPQSIRYSMERTGTNEELEATTVAHRIAITNHLAQNVIDLFQAYLAQQFCPTDWPSVPSKIKSPDLLLDGSLIPMKKWIFTFRPVWNSIGKILRNKIESYGFRWPILTTPFTPEYPVVDIELLIIKPTDSEHSRSRSSVVCRSIASIRSSPQPLPDKSRYWKTVHPA